MNDIPFGQWVFSNLVRVGAVRDYDATPPSGKGKRPKGNLSVSVAKLQELRQSQDPNEVLWGLIGASLVGLGDEVGAGKRLINEYKNYVATYCKEEPRSLWAMERGAIAAGKEFKSRYREKEKAS